jgi:hypothetical protein
MEEFERKMKTETYVEEAIVQLLSLKLRAGSTLDEVKSFASKCIDIAGKNVEHTTKTHGLDIHRLGSVLRAWHTETRFLDENGAPKPMKKKGRNSLEALVRLYYPVKMHTAVLQRLRAASLIKRSSRDTWLPTGQHARISQLSYETLEHLSEGVARYVETVTGNVTAKNQNAVLFERSCKVTRLPQHEIKYFRAYVAEQATAFITAIDDWLESRNAPSTSRKRLKTAGLYAFAYADRD